MLKRPLLILCIYLLLPFPNGLFKQEYSKVITDESGRILRVFLSSNEQFVLPPSKEDVVPEKLSKAVLVFEDQYFKYHLGINPGSIFRAIFQNIRAGEVKSGASTITMQVARLRRPKKRNVFNKIREILVALRIDLHYSKNKILYEYLCHAPYGSNIVGYQAASWKYFGKPADELSWAQAATLAVLPNSPGIIFPSEKNQELKLKRNRLLEKLEIKGFIDEETCELAKLEEVPDRIYPFPFYAPHFTRMIDQANLTDGKITTTLDLEIQNRVRLLCKKHMNGLNSFGIHNCAVLIAENKTGKIKAWIGSQDYYDTRYHGRVDGVVATRSSGSILKPFLFGLAMDEGLILPSTLIKDVPTYFQGFSPHNATETYEGIVPASEALTRSLNVPAVRLLNAYGIHQFYSFLKEAGLTSLFRTSDEYGLPLIIGGAEVSLLEMAAMYRSLARGGYFQGLTFLSGQDNFEQKETNGLISEGASFLTLEMLKEVKRPGVEYYWHQYQNQNPVAWKTGTSYGQKDGWAIGVNPDWVVAVWVGNFSGEGNPNLTGASSAGPLLFTIFNTLPESKGNFFEKPEYALRTVKVCNSTGFIFTDNCEGFREVETPLHAKTINRCPFHRFLYLDANEEYEVCSQCWDLRKIKMRFLLFPPDVNFYSRQRGLTMSSMPNHHPDCKVHNEEKVLNILYPANHAKIWLPRNLQGEFEKLVFRITHHEREITTFWYLDDKYLGHSKGKFTKAVHISKGKHKLFVIDENGNQAYSEFFVTHK